MMRTLAPLTTAPWASVTVPRTVPRNDCATAGVAEARATSSNVGRHRCATREHVCSRAKAYLSISPLPRHPRRCDRLTKVPITSPGRQLVRADLIRPDGARTGARVVYTVRLPSVNVPGG